MSILNLPIPVIKLILSHVNVTQKILFSMTCKKYYDKCYPSREELSSYLIAVFKYTKKYTRRVSNGSWRDYYICYICGSRNPAFHGDYYITCTNCEEPVCESNCSTNDKLCLGCTLKCNKCDTITKKTKCSMCNIFICECEFSFECCGNNICKKCYGFLDYCLICKSIKCMEYDCHECKK